VIKYIGSHDAVDVAGRVVTKGEAVDLGDLEKSLLEQADNWQPVKTAPIKKAAGE
jgi:hypothetical protein